MNEKMVKVDYLCGSVIGHVDHGKTTLTAALTLAANKYYPEALNKPRLVDSIDNAPEEKKRGITITAAHVPIRFLGKEVSLTDCPGHQDYINNMILGTRSSDFGILVIAASEGVAPQTKQHISLAAALGVRKIFIVYNKMDMAEAQELIELVRDEVQELLKEFGMEEVGSVEISATKALTDENELDKLKGILTYMNDLNLEDVVKDEEFRVVISDIHNPKGQGTIVSGKVAAGRVDKGSEIDIVGMNKAKVTGTIINMETFNRQILYGLKRMDLGMQIRGVNKANVVKGMTIVKKGKAFTIQSFSALFQLIDDPKQGRRTPFKVGFEPQCFVNDLGISLTCKVIEIKGAEYAQPGDLVELKIELQKPVTLFEQSRVFLRESNKTIGFGQVTELDASTKKVY